MRGLQRYAVERRDALASGVLQLVGELSGIVRHHPGTVPCPADRHVECLAGGEPAVVRQAWRR